jgi:hypothetical protein
LIGAFIPYSPQNPVSETGRHPTTKILEKDSSLARNYSLQIAFNQ